MIRHKITRMTATTYALESMVYLTAGPRRPEASSTIRSKGACCKVFGTEVLWQNINDGLQIAGGNGFMNEYPYGRALRDSRINMIFEGTNEILRLLHRALGHEGARRLAEGGPGRAQEPARAARRPDRVRPQADEGRHHARQAHEGASVARARGRPGRAVRRASSRTRARRSCASTARRSSTGSTSRSGSPTSSSTSTPRSRRSRA